jgi:hypothetical protein
VDKPLTQEQLGALLDQWVDSDVTIRVVSKDDDLIAVFQGRLGARTDAKQPALFWPLRVQDLSHQIEQSGIYLHPEHLHEALAREGGFVVELRQAEVTLNVRRL